MEGVEEAIRHTPVWVLGIVALLVWRGIRASRGGVISVSRLLLVPALLLVLGLFGLSQRFGISAATLGTWLAALLVGCLLGHLMLRRVAIRADHERRLIARPGDWTFLPLLLAVFVANYSFAAITAMHPDRLHDPVFVLSNVALSGTVSGVFLGKMLTYFQKYRAAPSVTLGRAAG